MIEYIKANWKDLVVIAFVGALVLRLVLDISGISDLFERRDR